MSDPRACRLDRHDHAPSPHPGVDARVAGDPLERIAAVDRRSVGAVRESFASVRTSLVCKNAEVRLASLESTRRAE
jgi:hypothetical protein